jgi:amino-acid N-acetyltransferase
MQIIPATVQDESGIKALLRTCELPADDLSASHLEHFFVIKDAGRIVGSVGLEVCGEYGLLRSLALTESLRGRGLGIQLAQSIEAYASSQQIKSLYLLTTTAGSFFAHLRYQVIPRENAPARLQETAEFQSICPASAVCMYKEL